MPSTGWNVFVASVVALVVFIAVRAEMVLLGLIAGMLTFVVGWLLGYAITQDLLDSMELSRIVGAGAVTVFAIVWTLLYSQDEYILGLIVVCLSWFAAWFTSSMGPIKGDTGAMATIDEPRPPAGSDPEAPIGLGGPDEPADDGGGFFSRLFGFGEDEAREPRGYAADEAASATDVEYDAAEQPHRERTEPTRTSTTDTGGSAESIFGLGIFYEGDPTEPSAGADDDGRAASADAGPNESAEANRNTSAPAEPADPPEQTAESAATDHTRATATGPVHRDAADRERSEATEPSTAQSPIDEAALDPPAEETGDSDARRQDPGENAGRPDRENATAASETYNTYRGDAGEGPADAPDRPREQGKDEEDEDDEPPEDHRVDVDEDDGFIFG